MIYKMIIPIRNHRQPEMLLTRMEESKIRFKYRPARLHFTEMIMARLSFI